MLFTTNTIKGASNVAQDHRSKYKIAFLFSEKLAVLKLSLRTNRNSFKDYAMTPKIRPLDNRDLNINFN